MKQSVVLLSGGIDSAACLLMAIDEGSRVTAVWIDYGQPANMAEYKAAFKLCKELSVPLETVGITLGTTAMKTDKDGPRIVPHRNALMIAAALAKKPGAREVWIGAIADDATVYEDCQFGYLAGIGYALKVEVRSLTYMSKIEVISYLRARLCYDIARLVSCYEGTNCGTCQSCQERNRALRHIHDEALRITDGDAAKP